MLSTLLVVTIIMAAQNGGTAVIEGEIVALNPGNPRPRPNLACRITVASATDKGTLSVLKPGTKVTKIEKGKEVAATPDDLKVGVTVRVTYKTPVMQTRVWQTDATEVVILKTQ
jgi:hypothetical protein